MPAVTLYLSDSDYQLYLKLDKGDRSRIYGEALRAEFDAPKTLEDVNKKIESAEQEQIKINARLTYWQAKKAKMREQESELQRQKELIEIRKEGGPRWVIHELGERFKEITGREMTVEDAQACNEWRQQTRKSYGQWIEHLKQQARNPAENPLNLTDKQEQPQP